MKKILSLIFIVALTITFMGCKNSEEKQNEVIEIKPIVAVIVDVGGIGDHSFNDATLSALEDVQKDKDVQIRCLEGKSQEDYDDIIKEALGEGAVITIAVGSNMEKSIEKAAIENPDRYFGIIDGKSKNENVKGISFADNESGFLAGYTAAKTSITGKIGFIGGDDRDTVDLFKYGYIAGARAAREDIVVEIDYIGSFYNKKRGYDIAEKMFREKNTDVIMHVAGPSGIGVIEAAKDNDFWVIGADKDQSHLASKNVLCSAVKDMTPGMLDMVKSALSGKFEGGNKIYNMKDKGIKLADSAGNIDKDIKKEINSISRYIKKEKLSIPIDEKSLEEFIFPNKILGED